LSSNRSDAASPETHHAAPRPDSVGQGPDALPQGTHLPAPRPESAAHVNDPAVHKHDSVPPATHTIATGPESVAYLCGSAPHRPPPPPHATHHRPPGTEPGLHPRDPRLRRQFTSLRRQFIPLRRGIPSLRSGQALPFRQDCTEPPGQFFEILMRVVLLFEVRVKKLAHSLRFPFLARDHTGTLEVNSNIDRRRTGGCPAQQRVCLMKATIRRTIEMSNGC